MERSTQGKLKTKEEIKMEDFFKNLKLKQSEILLERTLTTEECWEVVFWSFYYSRGSEFVQSYILEFIRRHFKISPNFSESEIPESIVERALKFRQSDRHNLANKSKESDEKKVTIYNFKKTSNYLTDKSIPTTKMSYIVVSNLGTDLGNDYIERRNQWMFRMLYELSNDQFENVLAKLLLSIDFYWLKKGNKNSNVVDNYLNSKKPKGGPVFEIMWTRLNEYFAILESSQEIVINCDLAELFNSLTESSSEIFSKLKENY